MSLLHFKYDRMFGRFLLCYTILSIINLPLLFCFLLIGFPQIKVLLPEFCYKRKWALKFQNVYIQTSRNLQMLLLIAPNHFWNTLLWWQRWKCRFYTNKMRSYFLQHQGPWRNARAAIRGQPTKANVNQTSRGPSPRTKSFTKVLGICLISVMF